MRALPAESRSQAQHAATVASKPSSHKKRKRARNASSGEPQASDDGPERPTKQLKKSSRQSLQSPDAVDHALLAQYYPSISTLRQYVLDNLPASSRIRRRKIASLGGKRDPQADGTDHEPEDMRAQLAKLLDTTLVGRNVRSRDAANAQSEACLQQWIDYSQADDSHVTLSSGDASAVHRQSEIVDFIIWLLFSREKNPSSRPHHLLCDGFRKHVGPRHEAAPSSIPGLFILYVNERVAATKQAPWPQLLLFLGKSGEKMMIDLLLDCSIFLPVKAGRGNYYQLSGAPIFESEPLLARSVSILNPGAKKVGVFERKPSEILFVRSRVLYARAALNARGLVRFGFRHIHALNRFPLVELGETRPMENGQIDSSSSRVADSTLRIMMYMFPRQFGLHNAFTSNVDPSKTAQKFQDYTLREDEIHNRYGEIQEENTRLAVHVPKRLRGQLKHLVRRLQTLHTRCSYARLLQHYCPAPRLTPGDGSERYSGSAKTAPTSTNKSSGKTSRIHRKPRQSLAPERPASYSSLTELAAPISHVSVFCQAVLSRIIPHEFWGQGDVQKHNQQVFLKNINRFIKLRRFETISLHEVMHGLKTTDIDWLGPPGLKSQKCSQTDFRKRNEIFSEFVFYVFDSLLIPLIRSNFYVTESNVHRYRLFYFRHDVWKSITEPAMAELKAKMFEEVKADDAMKILDSRRLGYSQVRLLPKQKSVRPIMNLRRRMITRKDNKILGMSINSILGPVYDVLKLEKTLHTSRLGSTMFSVGDIYKRLSSFKQRMGSCHGSLYFAKVDVQAAFDTIPQAAIVALMKTVPSQAKYDITKHVEVQLNEGAGPANTKAIKRWHSLARAAGDNTAFLELIERQTMPNKTNTVFVDSVFRRSYRTQDLLALMTSHIEQNLVKIGKKYYRQKDGIPQGSVLSSMLCNYFYADLEKTQLQFLQEEDCLLLRLIDDFLLITTSRAKAAKFVTVMQKGSHEHGVTVSPSKTLVNFPLNINSQPVPITTAAFFPYCGSQINTETLELIKDRALPPTKDPTIANALTVEFTRRPGHNFKRKVLNAFRLQSHVMFFDGAHNTAPTVLRNLHDALVETAAKAWAYARCLPPDKQPSPELWIDAAGRLAESAYLLLTSRTRRLRHPGYDCRVTKYQVRWLTLRAFRTVLGRKQARFGEVLAWLDGEMRKMEEGKQGRRRAGRHVAALV